MNSQRLSSKLASTASTSRKPSHHRKVKLGAKPTNRRRLTALPTKARPKASSRWRPMGDGPQVTNPDPPTPPRP